MDAALAAADQAEAELKRAFDAYVLDLLKRKLKGYCGVAHGRLSAVIPHHPYRQYRMGDPPWTPLPEFSHQGPDFKEIGNPEIITKRGIQNRSVSPRGSLNDYIPFYFTPFSPML